MVEIAGYRLSAQVAQGLDLVTAPDELGDLAWQVGRRVQRPEAARVVGGVVGAHVGPGMVSVGVAPRIEESGW